MTKTLGCIGCGNMGSAILSGLAGREGVRLLGLDMNIDKVQQLCDTCGVEAAGSLRDLVKQSDFVLVSVKPQHVRGVLEEIAPRLRPEQTLISIAAGITLTQLKDWSSGSCPAVRVMPNTPAMVGGGVIAVCLDDPSLTPDQKGFVSELFFPIGKVYVLPEESFDAFTAVAGSGPAYVFYFMESVIEAAVSIGLPRDKATDIVQGLFSGSCKLADESDQHLSVLREMVCSPGGTTIAATNVLDGWATRGHVIDAIKAAHQRSKELGQ